MEKKESRRIKSLRLSQKSEVVAQCKVEPHLWSNLPQEILLDIFDALPVTHHYGLRGVCKQWYEARKRRQLLTQDPVRVLEPFFLITQKRWPEISPMGMLALHAAMRKWIWRSCNEDWRMERNFFGAGIGRLSEAFEMEGVFFQLINMLASSDLENFHLTHGGPKNVLFDVHQNNELFDVTEGAYGIPYPKRGNLHLGSVLGMMVDDASRAYMLILESCTTDTLLLSSHTNKWESKPSCLVRLRPPSLSNAPKSCVQLQGNMYLWMDSDEIHVYSLSSDKWSALSIPPRDTSSDNEFRGFGHCANVLYAVTKNEHGTLSVWKLNMLKKQWCEYSQIPTTLFEYLIHRSMLPIMVSHCNGYLLIHVLAPEPKQQRFKLSKQQSSPNN